MRIYMDQVPEEFPFDSYPEHTKFILDDSCPERDPVTFRLIRRPRRTPITPDDIKKAEEGIQIPPHKYIALLRNGNNVLCPECHIGHVGTAYNPATSHFFSCDNCDFMINID